MRIGSVSVRPTTWEHYHRAFRQYVRPSLGRTLLPNVTPARLNAFYADLLPALRDPRYIQVDGKPMLLIYRIADMPDAKGVITGWKRRAKQDGLGGLHVLAVLPSRDFAAARPDVAASFRVPAYANSGYTFDLLAEQFAPGAHTAFFRVLTSDQKGFWEAGPYTLDLK